MGSAQENPKTEKKKVFKEFKNKLYSAFQKKKGDIKTDVVPEQLIKRNVNDPPDLVPVSTLLADFDRLRLEKAEKQAGIKAEIDEDELKNFSYKIVKKEQNTSRSSKDSGFTDESNNTNELEEDKRDVTNDQSETADDENEDDELVQNLKGLGLNNHDDKRGKKVQQVFIARGKDAQKGFKPHPFAPYQTFSNRQCLSGGQVIVNPIENAYTDINQALSDVDRTVCIHAHTTQDEMLENLHLAQEFIHDDIYNPQEDKQVLNEEDAMEILQYINDCILTEYQLPNYETAPTTQETEDPIEEFHRNEVPHYSEFDTSLSDNLLDVTGSHNHDNILTPPRSNEDAFNPDSPFSGQNVTPSLYSVNSPVSDYTRSPSDHSLSPSNEQYQEIPVFTDLPESVVENEEKSPQERERFKSNSSLNLKQFKDIQNKLSADFAKGECCKKEVGSAREVLKVKFMGLDEGVRKDLCMRLAVLPLNTCYGVLQHILMGLTSKSEQDDLLFAVFSLICERVLGERPQMFVEDFGLNLLKAASLRCPERVILTRYIVQCVRIALATPAVRSMALKGAVFTESDKLGDNLLGALSRRGDACACVLAELVRDSGELPLFDVLHTNNEGMSALHVACSGHGASCALHTVHVLLEHAGADVWQGDIKGGDTALHYAVKPGTCDLDLVMTLFKHVDRKKWKQFAHANNRSLVSPIETARAATKSSRHNYPEEVLNFLKKCRN